MLIILLIFPIFLGVSYIFSRFLLRIDYGPFSKVLLALRFIGVAVHELSHFTMCIIVGIRPKGIVIRLRSKSTGKVSPSGKVPVDWHNGTFLQAMFICLAPLIFSTWLFFWSLSIAFTADQVHPLIRIAAGFFCVSLFLGATPSKPDFMIIGHWFKEDPKYSLYQVGLLVLSGFFVWGILVYYSIVLPLDIIYYILVGVGYYVVKYSFRAVGWALFKVATFHNPQKSTSPRIKYRRFMRRRFKPSKPSKLGKREAPW